jgi:hypothetical protein
MWRRTGEAEIYLADGWEYNMATIVLDATTKSLEVKLGEAKNTTDIKVSITWADSTSNGTALAEGSTQATSNGTTAVTIAAAPAASTKRIVRDGEFYNADVISHVIYVQINSNSTLYIIGKATLAAGASCTLDSIIGSAALGYSAPKLDDCAAPDNNTDLDASTTAHGLLLKATAPAANVLNVVGIANGETVYANKALFDATAPTKDGTASAGTGVVAARVNHIHPEIRYITVLLNSTTALTTSEKAYFRIPADLNGANLVSVAASVGTGAAGSSSSGNPTFTVKNVTDNTQMLSTSLTIDATEYTSASAATPAVIDTTHDDVVTDDLIEIAVTTSGTGVTYASVQTGWQIP